MNYKTLIAKVLAALKSDHPIVVTGNSAEITEQVAHELAALFKRRTVSPATQGLRGHERFSVFIPNNGGDPAVVHPVNPPFVFTAQEANVIAYELDSVIALHERNAILERAVLDLDNAMPVTNAIVFSAFDERGVRTSIGSIHAQHTARVLSDMCAFQRADDAAAQGASISSHKIGSLYVRSAQPQPAPVSDLREGLYDGK